jgi:ubiquinone biosynthesis protein UbiJ
MPDWSDPSTWRDIAKYNSVLSDLSKYIAEARRRGDAPVGLEVVEGMASVLQGHHKTLADVSFVAGKLVEYTSKAHEERRLEIDAIHDLSKSLRQLTRTVDKLARRVEKLERKAAKPVKKPR